MTAPYYADEWLTVLEGDCREVMAGMEPESVHCVVTSPPYWGLRDYGTPGQLGLEPTPDAYVAALVEVFRAVRRVLRADGTVWLVLGDSYSGGKTGRDDAARRNGSKTFTDGEYRPMQDGMGGSGGRNRPVPVGMKPKDLVGIPWRVAFALQADGWYLRSDVIWSKPNPMPESVTDRPTKSHEYVFLLSKSARYFFDADAVREDADSPMSQWRSAHGIERQGPKADDKVNRQGLVTGRVDSLRSAGRNLRSVWQIATAPYPGAHFATFPPKLVEPCIKAGTSEKGVCPECGAPWERVVEREREYTRPIDDDPKYRDGFTGPHRTKAGLVGRPIVTASETTGWRPTCRHTAEPVPAVVLDIFAGTGTVGLVAAALSRRAVLIDLNAEYLRQCLDRNRQMPLGVA